MNLQTLRIQTCSRCQHNNPPYERYCERCQNLLQTPSGAAELAMGWKLKKAPAQRLLSNDDSDLTTNYQLGNVPTLGSKPMEASPLAAPLSPDQLAIDLHRPTPARLQHDSSERQLVLATDAFFWRIGKPHQGAQPDLDVSKFPQSQIVSRYHALIRYHRGQYYIEDKNSSNGTYVNGQWLAPGRQHAINHNDCIALGKGDLVRFFFQLCTAEQL